MPRIARIKEENKPHHIMSKSIEECLLYKDNQDKYYYMELLKKAKFIYQIELLAYCLMSNHVHLLIHPRGADISKVMAYINNKYARYYNKRYNRKGHLFTERFKNSVIESESYLLKASAYIHMNPKSMGLKTDQDLLKYPFSSYKAYIYGSQSNTLVDTFRILGLLSGGDAFRASLQYQKLMILEGSDIDSYVESICDLTYYEEHIKKAKAVKRQIEKGHVKEAIQKIIGGSSGSKGDWKRSRKTFGKKVSLTAICLKIFSDLTIRHIQMTLMGYTESDICQLCQEGLDLLRKKPKLYQEIFESL